MKPLTIFSGLLFYLCSASAQNVSRPLYLDPSKPIDQRVNDLIDRLTLEEKAATVQSPQHRHSASQRSQPGAAGTRLSTASGRSNRRRSSPRRLRWARPGIPPLFTPSPTPCPTRRVLSITSELTGRARSMVWSSARRSSMSAAIRCGAASRKYSAKTLISPGAWPLLTSRACRATILNHLKVAATVKALRRLQRRDGSPAPLCRRGRAQPDGVLAASLESRHHGRPCAICHGLLQRDQRYCRRSQQLPSHRYSARPVGL